jgi:hypothetical protein
MDAAKPRVGLERGPRSSKPRGKIRWKRHSGSGLSDHPGMTFQQFPESREPQDRVTIPRSPQAASHRPRRRQRRRSGPHRALAGRNRTGLVAGRWRCRLRLEWLFVFTDCASCDRIWPRERGKRNARRHRRPVKRAAAMTMQVARVLATSRNHLFSAPGLAGDAIRHERRV